MAVTTRDIYIPGQGGKMTEIGVNDYSTRKFGTYHMADSPDLYEPLRTNNFEFMVSGLGKKIKQSMDTAGRTTPYFYKGFVNDSNYVDTIDEVIRISVDSAFVPHFSLQSVPVKRGNSTVKYAGQPTFAEGSIKIKDYIGMDTKMALLEWQNLAYNVITEKIGLASDYKIDCLLTEFTPDYIPVRSWKIMGCWISNISEGPFDASASDNVNSITATIQYDKGIPWDLEKANYTTLNV